MTHRREERLRSLCLVRIVILVLLALIGCGVLGCAILILADGRLPAERMLLILQAIRDRFNISLAIGVAGTIVGVISLLVAVASWRVAVSAKRQDREIAEAEGVFSKPNVKLNILGMPVLTGRKAGPASHNWLFILPGSTDDAAIFVVPIVIANLGDAPTKDIVVSITVPRGMHTIESEEGIGYDVVPSLYEPQLRRSVDEIGRFAIVAYSIPPIQPHGAVSIEEYFRLFPSFGRKLDIDLTLPLSKSDDREVSGTVTIGVYATFAVSVALRSLDTATVHSTIGLGALAASSLREGVEKYVETIKKARREESDVQLPGLMRFIDQLVNPRKYETWNLFAFEVEQEVVLGDRKGYVMRPPRKLKRCVLMLDKQANVTQFIGDEQDWEEYNMATVIHPVRPHTERDQRT